MSAKLPEFPTWPAVIKSYDDEIDYERARADAWEARCRVAVEALEYTRAHISMPQEAPWIHTRVFNALHEIGPLPPGEGE